MKKLTAATSFGTVELSLADKKKRTGGAPVPSRANANCLLRFFDDDADVLAARHARGVEEPHRRVVVDVARAGEENHLAGVAVHDLADALRERVQSHVFFVDEHSVLGLKPEDDLILHRGWRKIRGRLRRNPDEVSHL